MKNVQINEGFLYPWSKVLTVIFYHKNRKYLFLWLKICCVLHLHRMLLDPSITPTISRNALYFDGNDNISLFINQFLVLRNYDRSPVSTHIMTEDKISNFWPLKSIMTMANSKFKAGVQDQRNQLKIPFFLALFDIKNFASPTMLGHPSHGCGLVVQWQLPAMVAVRKVYKKFREI